MTDVFAKCRPLPILETVAEKGINPCFRPLQGWLGPGEAQVDDRRVLTMASNDYLGLSMDPRVHAAAADAIRRYGSSSSGARIFNGTTVLHEELEHRLAAFLGRPEALVVTTGFQTNLALAALMDRSDIAFGDRSNHASLTDAIRLGQATHRRYRHNDLGHLERLLRAADPSAGKLIITDGVFSMEGDLADLPGIAKLACTYDARLVVDGAHDIGLLGTHGRGLAEHYGIEDGVDLLTGTLSKCFASLGGVIAGSSEVVDYLRVYARSFMFAAAMPPSAAAAALASLTIIESQPELRHRALTGAQRLHNGLRAIGYSTGNSATPVVPVLIGQSIACGQLWQKLFDNGVYTNAVVAPGVPEGHGLIRVIPQAVHTDAQIDRVIDTFATAGRTLGLIPPTPPQTFTPVAIAWPHL